MLIKVTVLDRVEVLSQVFRTLQVRYIKDRIIDDTTGETVAEGTYWRVVYGPGDDLSHEDPQVQAVGATLWTAPVVQAYKDALTAQAAAKAATQDGAPLPLTEIPPI